MIDRLWAPTFTMVTDATTRLSYCPTLAFRRTSFYFPKRAGFPVLFFELNKAKAAFVIGPISSYWIIPYEVGESDCLKSSI